MENKSIWIGVVLGIISSLYFVYRAIEEYSFTLEEPISYTFINHPIAIIFPIVISMIFWIFFSYLTWEVIKLRNILVWCSFVGGSATFFYSVLFLELDSAGGLIQLSWITILGIIGGLIIGFLIRIIKFIMGGRGLVQRNSSGE